MHSKEFIELLKILIDTYDKKLIKENYNNIKEILEKLDKETIEQLLFRNNEQGIKTVDSRALGFLRENQYDMKDICFDNVDVSNHNYSNMINITINIENVLNKDISNTVLDGVTLIGCLDNAIVNGANFKGYKGKIILNPQKVKNKDISITTLDGVIIDGIFDDCDIFGANFTNALGGIYINPQKIKDKDLKNTTLSGVNIIGEKGKKPDFTGCKIRQTSFKDAKGIIEIDPQKLDVHNNYLLYCDFSGVKFIGGFENFTLFGNEFKGSQNALIDLNRVRDARIITQKDLQNVDYIPLKEKQGGVKILSKFRKKYK